jgi:hypothetical protein
LQDKLAAGRAPTAAWRRRRRGRTRIVAELIRLVNIALGNPNAGFTWPARLELDIAERDVALAVVAFTGVFSRWVEAASAASRT